MSETEQEQAGALERAYRTVTPSTGYRPDVEMDVIGWSIFLGLVFLLLPLLPFIVIIWVVTKLLRAVTQEAPEDEVQ
jgi:uncharacterized membrane protein YhdT